ncbi:hypothetical protein N7513_011809 [Penicillium frequentans]|uniref:Uncharacterized protein n=1 Tax=Penicillium frequentans TaxID=3151616 RepID=A0AAD6GH60_9EURO|nr:hypothetical protein N7513_011809 [Penicillium glabrum]KAJ5546702.1 hypothetical protein N7494_004287 [Penicillium glabrum]
MSIIAAVTTVMVAILSGAATGAAEKEGSGGVCRASVNKGRNHSRVGAFPGDGETNPDNGEEDDDGDPGVGDLG